MEKQHSNQLIHETSPYLLQHSHNPVNWYPWGDEALNKAKTENKLLLISIGYSACHWCHVMEHESFEDEQVAQVMNANFVCIKVDREERPDIDQVYMDAVQLMTGRGGWPLNCIALPNGSPVYGGTYFRKNEWVSILNQLKDIFTNDPDRLTQQAASLKEGLTKQENLEVSLDGDKIDRKNLEQAMATMADGFDKEEGGFNGAPKFPNPAIWHYVLTQAQLFNDKALLEQVLLSLDKMALGGIYDHVGGGFSRYSVDDKWHVPHFEKMLYDNAQLVSLYCKAFQETKNDHYKHVVYETLNFVNKNLSSEEGAFYSALDADSDGEEGKFYAWTSSELETILGSDYPLFAEYFSVTSKGNWENGKNILKAQQSAKCFSMENGFTLNNFLSDIEISLTKLKIERRKRVRPGLDDKVLTSWNGLMLKAYIDTYNTFGNAVFLERALLSAEFIREKLMKADGGLYRSYKNGTAKINGFLEDYSFSIEAFIELYQTTFDETWMLLAKDLTEYTLKHFYDSESAYFYFTSDEDKELLVRKREIADNVIPASNSSMAHNLYALSKFFGEPEYEEKALHMLNNQKFEVEKYSRFYANWSRLAVKVVSNPKEVVITGPNARQNMAALKWEKLPNVVYALAQKESDLPILKDRFKSGEDWIYICENNICQLPVKTLNEALELLGGQ